MKNAVFITGACRGTGYRIAEVFAQNGWSVIVTGRNGSDAALAAEKIAQTYGVFAKGYECNIRNEQQVTDIFKDIDDQGVFVETVVLCAADLGFGTDPSKGMDFFSVPVEEFQRVFETNLVWNFTIVRHAALRMREKGKGSIVFISSNTAYNAIPNRSAYCASKGGINSLSKAIAVDLGKYGIRSNVVLPGTIKTARWEAMGSSAISGKLTPIGDISDFDDIANAVWYFASDNSLNTTGAELVVDGGNMIQRYPIIPKN